MASKRSPKANALGAREYSKFREVADGEYVIGTSNEDVSTYPATIHATSAGATEVVAAPGAGKALKIKYLMVNNATATILAVSFRQGAVAVDYFMNSMPQYGGMWNFNFVNGAWVLDANVALNVILGAGGGSVYVQVGYEVVDVASTNIVLTDSMDVAESSSNVHVAG